MNLRASCLALASLLLPGALFAQDVSGPSFKPGDVIGFEQLDKLERYLPKEFWDNRDFFFYEGMQLRIGPTNADYTPADAYEQATKSNAGVGEDRAGEQPEGYERSAVPMDKIDCKNDPQAGVKIAWTRPSLKVRAAPRGSSTVLDGRERRRLLRGQELARRLSVEPEYQAAGGDVFRGEQRACTASRSRHRSTRAGSRC